MRTGMKFVAWILAVVAAGAIVGGAYLFGIDRGLFSPGREDEVGRLLLTDDQVQRAIAVATVDALVEQISLAEAVRPRLEDAAFRVTQTDRYAELFQGAVDLAYARALNDGAASRSVVLTLDDVIELLGGDAITLLGGVDLGSLGGEGVELVGAGDLRRIRRVQDFAHRWALPLLSLGAVLAIAALALPGRREPPRSSSRRVRSVRVSRNAPHSPRRVSSKPSGYRPLRRSGRGSAALSWEACSSSSSGSWSTRSGTDATDTSSHGEAAELFGDQVGELPRRPVVGGQA